MYQQIQKSIYSAWSCCILHLHGVGSCFVVYFGARVLKTLPLFSKQTLFFLSSVSPALNGTTISYCLEEKNVFKTLLPYSACYGDDNYRINKVFGH